MYITHKSKIDFIHLLELIFFIFSDKFPSTKIRTASKTTRIFDKNTDSGNVNPNKSKTKFLILEIPLPFISSEKYLSSSIFLLFCLNKYLKSSYKHKKNKSIDTIINPKFIKDYKTNYFTKNQ